MKQDCSLCPELVKCRTQIVYASPCKVGGLLVIGEAPGTDEDKQGEGFVGVSGKTLDKLLSVHQIYRNDYGRANICRCRPPHNRKPTPNEISSCLGFLADLINMVQPKVVLTIGAIPTNVFCGKGTLYSKIINGDKNNNWNAINYINFAHPKIADVLHKISYIIPSPHTSPLAFNRNCLSGEKWSSIAIKQVSIAVSLLT